MDLFGFESIVRGKAFKPNPLPNVPNTGWRLGTSFPDLSGANVICVDVETYDPQIKDFGSGWGSGRGHVIGISLATDDGFNQYFPIRHTVGVNHDPQQIIAYVREQLSRANQPKVFHNALYDVGYLEHEGIPVLGKIFCTWIAEKLINHSASASLEDTAQRYLGKGKSSEVLYQWSWEAFGKGKPKSASEMRSLSMKNLYRTPAELVGFYAESDTALPIRILPEQWDKMASLGLLDVFEMECGLIPLLVQMRREGVSVDLDAAERASKQIETSADKLQLQVNDLAGCCLNTGSPIEVGRVFDRLKIKYPLTEKSGKPQLKGEFLKTLSHPLGNMIVELQELLKYNSTFVKGFILDSHIKGKIYPSFNMLRAVTGRASCVTGDTLVLTKRGYIRMDSVVVGDYVWTHKGRWRPVTHHWRVGVEKTVDLKFSDGCSLTCTKDHRLFTSCGKWITAAELTKKYVYLSKTHKQPSDRCNSLAAESAQQRIGQFSSMYEGGAQGDSHTTSGFTFVELEEIHLGGSHAVYDITVLEDESYWSNGVFSHNCSQPNCQQIPSRNELAKVIRSIFVPDVGHNHFRKYDYSAVESRILGHFAVGQGSKELRQEYKDKPSTNYHHFTRDMIKKLVGLALEHKHVKCVNFAGIYGASEKKLQKMMGLTDQESSVFFSAYHSGLPYIKATMRHCSEQAEARGYTQTILGRRVAFDHFEPKFSTKGTSRLPALPYEKALQSYGVNIKRSYLHKALNAVIQGSAADLMKMAMLKCWQEGVFAETGVPRMVIHDELTFSVREGFSEKSFSAMKHIMETAIPFKVPILVEGEKGSSWGCTEKIID